MLNGKRPKTKGSQSLDALPFPLHGHRNKQEICGCEEPLCALTQVPQSSLLFVLLRRHSRVEVKGHPNRRVKGRSYFEPVLDPLTKMDVNRKTNKYINSHKAALWRSFS
ncbi:hypothetical protein CgunFtcFv8_010642 [Champsocephalus gunnari]|uniref:Uncharacterized protein n=1 Tax=Champsocephalus gunnari TaxID=52237 RepID=A0AAN8DU55_CHAGU|nr:hypothetical protein CgunFtcFv8_010642 [Champsocephalus gunnari]